MRALVVINPTARGGTFADVGEILLHRLVKAGWEARLRVPHSPEDARALIAAARDVEDAVVVAGGDGTVGIAVQELAGSQTALGVVPTGTGNDFANAVGLHTLDVRSAIDTVVAENITVIDLGEASSNTGIRRPFATVLASGFDSLVNDRANRMRFPRGHSRYNIAIAIEYLLLRRVKYRVSWVDADGMAGSSDDTYLMASVANTRSYGGGVPIAPHADPTDGLLELILVRPASRIRLLGVLMKVFRAAHENEPEVSIRRVRSATISAEGVRAYADGDPVSELPVTVSVLPGSLRLFTPKR